MPAPAPNPQPESGAASSSSHVRIPAGNVTLDGDLTIPAGAHRSAPVSGSGSGIVVFAHGSGSSRLSPRNQYVASVLNDAGLATLLMDLLTREEEVVDLQTRHLRFDIDMLGRRLVAAADWLSTQPNLRDARIGYFGASTGGGAALVAAAERPALIHAVVSRGGRPDLAGPALEKVQAPTLLIVGGDDVPVIGMNRDAMRQMTAEVRLEIVPGATHLFEEPGTLEAVARLAAGWFSRWLVGRDAGRGTRFPQIPDP